MKLTKSITNCYNKLSNFGKILIFIALLLIIIVFFKSFNSNKEGMTNGLLRETDIVDKFLFKEGEAIYDDFYANVYDYLVFNEIKNDYEIGVIINLTKPNEKSVIADIGCGTGHHVNDLATNNLNIIGVDISPSMIKKAKENYPYIAHNFNLGNVLENFLFKDNSLTHILCLYFTIYYIKDKMKFLYNSMNWLMPGGYLIIHLVDRYKFDPILPPGNPLYIVSPQKYAKERITTTKVTFNDFVYNADFKLNDSNDIAVFNEKFKFKNGNVRKHEQKLYMEDLPSIVNMAQDAGFLLHAKIDMVKCAYEYQYLYVFIKPS
jgi:ubiquinone/menaquinone biosynthesis C-methylase UbiE